MGLLSSRCAGCPDSGVCWQSELLWHLGDRSELKCASRSSKVVGVMVVSSGGGTPPV